MTLDERMIGWIRTGDRGISSEVIFEVLADHPLLPEHWRYSTPSDSSDFYRCYKLLRAVPEWRGRLNEVAAKHPHWRLIVKYWQDLEIALINDLVDDGRSCNRLLGELNKYRYAPEKYPGGFP